MVPRPGNAGWAGTSDGVAARGFVNGRGLPRSGGRESTAGAHRSEVPARRQTRTRKHGPARRQTRTRKHGPARRQTRTRERRLEGSRSFLIWRLLANMRGKKRPYDCSVYQSQYRQAESCEPERRNPAFRPGTGNGNRRLGKGDHQRKDSQRKEKAGMADEESQEGRHTDRKRNLPAEPLPYRDNGDNGQMPGENISLYTVKERYSFDDSINSKVLCFAFGLVAEIERNLISMRTKEALAVKRSEGVILGRRKARYMQGTGSFQKHLVPLPQTQWSV